MTPLTIFVGPTDCPVMDVPARMKLPKNKCDACITIHPPFRVHLTFIMLHDTPTVPSYSLLLS